MNKQALAFLTMFSLVLMLSVYYVTLPSDTTSVMSEDTSQQSAAEEKPETEDEKATVQEDEEELKKQEGNQQSNAKTADELQQEIDQRKDEELNRSSSVVSQNDEDEDSKKEALMTMDTLKTQKELQGTIRQALKEAGYDNAVEIQNQTCIVTVYNQEDDETLAKTIMNKTSEITNQKYFIEVAFK